MAHLRSVAAFLGLDKPGGVKLPLVERIVARLLPVNVQANGAEDAAAPAGGDGHVEVAAAAVEDHVEVDEDDAYVNVELLCPYP